MNYTKLFKHLREYAIETPNVNLKQFKEVSFIIWNNMSPTEKDLFGKAFNKSIVLLKKQESLRETVKRISKTT